MDAATDETPRPTRSVGEESVRQAETGGTVVLVVGDFHAGLPEIMAIEALAMMGHPVHAYLGDPVPGVRMPVAPREALTGDEGIPGLPAHLLDRDRTMRIVNDGLHEAMELACRPVSLDDVPQHLQKGFYRRFERRLPGGGHARPRRR